LMPYRNMFKDRG